MCTVAIKMARLYKRRRLLEAFTSEQMMQILSDLKLVAIILHGSVWVAIDPTTANLLDRCCTGQLDGGPDTAKEVLSLIQQWQLGKVVLSHLGQGGQGTSQESDSQIVRLCPVSIRLSLEESFFLVYVLGCLTVLRQTQDGTLEQLSEQQLWDEYRSIRGNFVVSYAGYHHMKSKGWLPRSGLLYGVDLVLYQMHPTAVHSEFGVMLMPLSGPHRPDLNWLDVQITNRLINQVSKRLVLLYLHEDPNSPGHSSPTCLQHFTAEERLVRRWVPSSSRM